MAEISIWMGFVVGQEHPYFVTDLGISIEILHKLGVSLNKGKTLYRLREPDQTTMDKKPTALEVRINSIHEAKAALQNVVGITKRFKDEGFTVLQFLIADEIKKDVMPILDGGFQVKTGYKTQKPPEGTVLFVLPPYKER
jgi:hypothetical protein